MKVFGSIRLFTQDSEMGSPDWIVEDLKIYLLGGLSKSRRTQLEQAYLEDGSLFERLEIAEDELVDQFVTGQLSWLQAWRFRRHYLISPPHRQKEEFARRLSEALAPKRTARSIGDFAVVSAAATLVVMFAGLCAWLAVKNRQQDDRLQRIEAGYTDLQRRAAQPIVPAKSGPIPAFVLFPYNRADLQEEKTIEIPEDADAIVLRASVGTDNSQSYAAAVIRMGAGQVIGAEVPRQGNMASITVPAKLFAKGNYQVLLRNDTGTFQQSYPFLALPARKHP